MILRYTLVILFMSAIFGCSNQSADLATKEEISALDGPVLAESNPGDNKVVCGALFKIKDFNTWVEAYNEAAEGTIILLRNVDDPSLILTFEGRQSQELVEKRALELMDEKFLNDAGIMGEPVVNYYDIQYMRQTDIDYKHYVGLIFEIDNINTLLKTLIRDINVYADYGLVPMGIGTDPVSATEVYMLLSLNDYVNFRKQTNSPRKFKRFISKLNLPGGTTISYWSKTSL